MFDRNCKLPIFRSKNMTLEDPVHCSTATASLPGDNCKQPLSDDSLAHYREHFPILAHTNYLISNSLGAVPATVASSLQTYFDAWASRGVRAWEDSWWTLNSD